MAAGSLAQPDEFSSVSQRVLIIGDGLAGLATAFHLLSPSLEIRIAPFHPHQDRSSPHHVPDDIDPPLDRHDATDQHEDIPLLVHGFHHETRSMLNSLHGPDILTRSTSVTLQFLRPAHRPRALRPFPAPAPFHIVLGLLCFRGLSLSDRWRLLARLERLWEGVDEDAADLEHQPASRWITRWEQSPEARQQIWDPLCRFLLGDPLSTASAASLKKALKQCFLSRRRDVRTILFSGNVRDMLIAPLQRYLSTRGVSRHEGQPVSHLMCDTHRVDGVVLRNGRTLAADDYVLALPPHHILSCLPERLLSKFSYFGNLQDIVSSPTTVIQLQFMDVFMCPCLFLCPPPFSWMVCQTQPIDDQQQTVISCVGPQDGEIGNQPDEALVQRVLAMLRSYSTLFDASHARRLSGWRVIREARTSYSSRPGFSIIRPLQQSPPENLFVAGGWTDTGLPPSSLESDLVSGKLCAAAIQDSLKEAR